MDRTAQESAAQAFGAKFPMSTGNLPGVCFAYLMIRDALDLRIKPLTQILTQNGKGAGGSGGGNKTGKHPIPEQKRPESAEKPPPAPLIAAHNPKVVGSNPAPRNHNSLDFLGNRGNFFVFLCFSGRFAFLPFRKTQVSTHTAKCSERIRQHQRGYSPWYLPPGAGPGW